MPLFEQPSKRQSLCRCRSLIVLPVDRSFRQALRQKRKGPELLEFQPLSAHMTSALRGWAPGGIARSATEPQADAWRLIGFGGGEILMQEAQVIPSCVFLNSHTHEVKRIDEKRSFIFITTLSRFPFREQLCFITREKRGWRNRLVIVAERRGKRFTIALEPLLGLR